MTVDFLCLQWYRTSEARFGLVQAERSERWTHRTERSEPRPSTVNRSRQAPPEAVGAAGGVSVGPTSRSGQASQAARPYHAWAAGPPFARQPLTRALMAAGGLAGPKAKRDPARRLRLNVALVSLVSLRSKAAWRPQSVRKALTGRRPPGSQSITSATFCRISFSGKYPTAGMYTMQRP